MASPLAWIKAWLGTAGDPSSPEGRAHERRRRILLSALAAGGAKAVSLAALLLTVPMTLGYLGVERYGLWTAVSGLLVVFSFADFGLGYGLVNTLAAAEGRGDAAAARKAVSSACFMLLGLGLALGLALALAWPWLDWGSLLNARSEATRQEAGRAMAVFAACFIVGLPLSVATHGYAALQQGYRLSLYAALGSLMSLASIVAVVRMQGGLPLLVLAASGVPLVATALGGYELYFRKRRELKPAWSVASASAAAGLAKTGGLFFVIQVAGSVAFQSDSLILARLLGPESVARYSLAQKLFLQVPFVLGYFLTPLWPAYAEALARRDLAWVKRILKKSLGLGLLVNLPFALALYFAAPAILEAWVGAAMRPPQLLLASLALWAALNSFNGPLGMFLNGVGALRYQAVSCSVMAALNLALSVALTRRLGMAGVVLGSIASQALCSYLPALVYLPRLMKRLETGSVMERA